MYGYVDGKPVTNPNTGESNCPAGFNSKQVLGTNDVDWSIDYCYKDISDPDNFKPSKGSSEFGGILIC